MTLDKEYIEIYRNNSDELTSYTHPLNEPDLTLDEKLAVIGHLMNLNLKDESAHVYEGVNQSVKDTYDIVMSTRRWKYICHKLQMYYNEPTHKVDVKSVLIKGIHDRIKFIIENLNSEEDFSKIIDKKEVLLNLINVYMSLYPNKYDIVKEFMSIDDYETKRVGHIIQLFPCRRLPYKLIIDLFSDFTRRIYRRNIGGEVLDESNDPLLHHVEYGGRCINP